MPMTEGLYVVCEGCDGSGKSTHVDLLVERFKANGLNPLEVAEPTHAGNPFGQLLRELIKTGQYAESYPALFLADRMALQTRVILPALAEGRPVISSRNFLSTLVYQAEEYPLDWLIALHSQLPAKPTHLIVLDIEPETGMERVGKRASLDVFENLEFQRKVRARYKDILDDPRLTPLLADSCRKRLLWTGRPDGQSTTKKNADLIWSIIND